MKQPAMEVVEDSKNSHSGKGLSICHLSVRKLAFVTVALPFSALVICFVTAYIFRYDEVHETHCQVYNVMPSISAITGITPQTYIWRICVALHIGPRILVAQIYKNYFSNRMNSVSKSISWMQKLFISSCYWLNIIEVSSLCGVTYVSNRENYPIHEKLFITFMVCSLVYMCIMTWSYSIIHPCMTVQQKSSFSTKLGLLITSVLSTISLVVFFLKHRLYCHDLAYYQITLNTVLRKRLLKMTGIFSKLTPIFGGLEVLFPANYTRFQISTDLMRTDECVQ